MNRGKRKAPYRLTEIIERAKEGDPDSLEELYERFKPMILRMVSKMNIQYREDAKEELIVELYEAIKRFEPKTEWEKKELFRHLEKHK